MRCLTPAVLQRAEVCAQKTKSKAFLDGWKNGVRVNSISPPPTGSLEAKLVTPVARFSFSQPVMKYLYC